MIIVDKYNIHLKIQEPIEFYNICVINQPSFIEIFQYGIEDFEKLLLPYYITLDSVPEELTDEQKEGIENFDLLCVSEEFMSYLFVSLEFFTKSKVNIDENGIFFKGFNGRLNRDNFDELAEIILSICGRNRPEKERVPVFAAEKGTPEYEDAVNRWNVLQEGRRRSNKKNELKLEDTLNVCEFGGKYHIPINEIKKWSLWNIINCYKTIMGISSYEDSFSIYLISGEKSLVENKHWSELIKLNYKI